MYTSTFYHILPLYIFLKIAIICAKFPDQVHNIPSVQKPEITSKMNSFERATEDEIKKLILSSSSKSCDLDPIRTNVLKYCLDILVTPITDTISISMDTSTLEKVVADWLQAPIKLSVYLIHYNQLTGNIILKNQLY